MIGGIASPNVLAPRHFGRVVDHVAWRDAVVDAYAGPAHSAEEGFRLVFVDPVVGGKFDGVIHHLVFVAHQLEIAVSRLFVSADQRAAIDMLFDQRFDVGPVLAATDRHYRTGGALADLLAVVDIELPGLLRRDFPQHHNDAAVRVKRKRGRLQLVPLLRILGRHLGLVFGLGLGFLLPSLALLAREVTTVDLDDTFELVLGLS